MPAKKVSFAKRTKPAKAKKRKGGSIAFNFGANVTAKGRKRGGGGGGS
jgi:hypothetical protein